MSLDPTSYPTRQMLLAILVTVLVLVPGLAVLGWVAYKHSWWRCRRMIRRLPEHRP